jgi:2-octaprenyl-6-methoxyphenol hydroxylase
MTEADKFDIAIIGGGMVGASLACALRDSGLRIAVIETVPLSAAAQPSFDDRTIALAHGGRRIFETMGVWEAIDQLGVAPIEHIHVSDRGRFGLTRLHASESGLPALGYVVESRVLGAALLSVVQQSPAIQWLCPATVTDLQVGADHVSLEVRQGEETRTLTTRLVAAADGADSAVREKLGISFERTEYDQTAVVTNATVTRPHEKTAYERFTRSGPLAILPMRRDAQVSREAGSRERSMRMDAQVPRSLHTRGLSAEHRVGVVWSVRRAEAETLLGWGDAEFLAHLQDCFGGRLGEFTRLGRRGAYPLRLTRIREQARPRVVLIGNAAHTVHPVAGQGFNLGLRDVAALAEVLVDASRAGRDFGELAVLREYTDWRARDNRVIAGFTDGLIRLFANDFLPLAILRNAGLIAVDVLPPIKRRFVRVTSGLAGRLPRLARGLPL